MPIVRGQVHRDSYRDSVELMGIAAQLERLPGIRRAGLVMATPANLGVLAEAGLADAAGDGAGPNDLIVALLADDDDRADDALGRAAALLAAGGTAGEAATETDRPQTLGEAIAIEPAANLALISTPGTYATAEALRALKRGLDVFLFSDNVPIEDEILLKALARERGLLVMGPDCGTAIIGGTPLGFANAVRRGRVGIAAASGTGLQQVSCLIHRMGAGVSHAIGTGGRDLDERVGGVTMLAALDRLLADASTDVIVLVSKPPSARVAAAILARVKDAAKPVVVNFLGSDPQAIRAAGAVAATTFEDAAREAVALLGGGAAAWGEAPDAGTARVKGGDGQGNGQRPADALGVGGPDMAGRLVRGLYSGGSLAGEAKLVLRDLLGEGRGDRIVDLGDDEYTVGRPHPMIDPRLRIEQIAAAAEDPAVTVLLLDVVLGYGSHPDPAGALAPAIVAARDAAAAQGRVLIVVASVCGTDADPQGFAGQEQALREAGVTLAPSNARAARLAAEAIMRAGTRAAVAPTAPVPIPSGAAESVR